MFFSERNKILIQEHEDMFENTLNEFTKSLGIKNYYPVFVNFLNIPMKINYDVNFYKLNDDIYVTNIIVSNIKE